LINAWAYTPNHTVANEQLELLSDLRLYVPVFRVEASKFILECVDVSEGELGLPYLTYAGQDIGKPPARPSVL
jgi:hypothetical protein